MTINDNTTTSLTVDFSDTILLSGTSMDYLFARSNCPSSSAWWITPSAFSGGASARNMDNWRNLTFDGGWDASGNGRPLGWQLDPTFGAGGSREAERRGLGRRVSHHRRRRHRRARPDLAKRDRRCLRQSAAANNTDYSVRARVKRSTQPHRRHSCASMLSVPPPGKSARASPSPSRSHHRLSGIHRAAFRRRKLRFPSDLTLRVYADGIPAPSGESFLVDNIEIFLTNAAQNSSLVRASRHRRAGSYDGVSGIMNIAENNGQGLRAAFTLRNNLYFVKERSMYVTATDGVNEPALWQVEEVSNKVGTPSAHGVGIGEEWVVIAGRSGLYLFDGSEPHKTFAGNSAYLGRDQLAVRPKSLGASGYAAQTHSRRRADGLGHAAESNPHARLHRRLRRSAGRDAQRARTLAQMGAVEYRREFLRPDRAANGVAQIFFGSNNSSGKIYALTPGAYSDDGAAINSFYTTAFLAATRASAARNLFGYLTAYVQGAGSLALAAQSRPADVTQPRARRMDARLARQARHGAVHQHARRARLLPIRHQRRRLLVLAHQARALGQARPLRHSPRHELTIRTVVVIPSGVSRKFVFARSVGTRSRGISLLFRRSPN